jgi:iron complex outermembrane recepter protein
MGRSKSVARRLGLALLTGTATIASATPSVAQSAAQPQSKTFDIARQSLASALNVFGRQAGSEVVFDPSVVRGLNSFGVRGLLAPDLALRQLLRGTKLGFHNSSTGAFVIDAVPDKFGFEVQKIGGVPEILVTATKSGWTLNTDVQRTMDDPQPYQIFTRDDIKRSGATDLQSFFHNFLNADTTPTTSTTAEAGKGGFSTVSLRGLGGSSTLILVDGRRLPGVSFMTNGSPGEIGQGQIVGIPLDSIERIEVLASSASGIYGANAAGGVINIITRHDYRGVRITGTFGDGVNGGPIDRRIDLSGGLALEGGKTNISFSGTWQDTDPLFIRDRDYFDAARQRAYALDPALYFKADTPPLGSTPNIHSVHGENLTLKPQYGGGSLGSSYTFLPSGYRGAALDGVGGLIANAGKYNYDLVDSSGQGGRNQELVAGSKLLSGTVAIRREMAHWLRLYVQAQGSISKNDTFYQKVPISLSLSASNPNNPFSQAITVVEAAPGTDGVSQTKQTSFGFTGGAIVTLFKDWSSNLDLSWSQNKYDAGRQYYVDTATYLGLLNGPLNAIVDTTAHPLDYGFLDVPTASRPGAARNLEASARIAGPLPITLPGGKPVLTTLLQFDRNTGSTGYNWSNQATISSVNYVPARSRNSYSAYGELTLPLIGEKNHIPLIRAFEIDAAGRFDRFTEKSVYNIQTMNIPGFGLMQEGSSLPQCYSNTGHSLPIGILDDLKGLCTLPGTMPISTSKSVINPTVSAKWTVTRDIAFRGSFSKGYQPLYLAELFTATGPVGVGGRDPLRGDEQIGIHAPGSICLSTTECIVEGKSGGNPNLKPQTSTSISLGTILTPHWVSGLRVSVDWTRIRIKNGYFSLTSILSGGGPASQALLEEVMKIYPDRFPRGAPSDGYSVGPILSVDGSLANISQQTSESFDIAADYEYKLAQSSRINFTARVSYLKSLLVQIAPGSGVQQEAGVVGQFISSGSSGPDGAGGLRWRGNAQMVWSNNKASLGVRAIYYGSYYLNILHTVDPYQGAAKVASQWYFDIFGSLKLGSKTELRAGMNDFLNTKPRYDYTQAGYYSRFSDPRQANYYLTVSRAL